LVKILHNTFLLFYFLSIRNMFLCLKAGTPQQLELHSIQITLVIEKINLFESFQWTFYATSIIIDNALDVDVY